MFILYKGKKNKLGIATWSLKELLLQIKQVKSPGRSSKFRQSLTSLSPQTLQTQYRVCGLLLAMAVLYLLEYRAMKHTVLISALL